MKKNFVFLILLFLLSGCIKRSPAPIQIDVTPLSEEKATLIIYFDRCCGLDFKIFIDEENVGVVTEKKPLKIEVDPGEHKIYAQLFPYVRRVALTKFEKGKTYFMQVWIDELGLFSQGVRIGFTNKIDSYQVLY